jgi:hypothetical protein
MSVVGLAAFAAGTLGVGLGFAFAEGRGLPFAGALGLVEQASEMVHPRCSSSATRRWRAWHRGQYGSVMQRLSEPGRLAAAHYWNRQLQSGKQRHKDLRHNLLDHRAYPLATSDGIFRHQPAFGTRVAPTPTVRRNPLKRQGPALIRTGPHRVA